MSFEAVGIELEMQVVASELNDQTKHMVRSDIPPEVISEPALPHTVMDPRGCTHASKSIDNVTESLDGTTGNTPISLELGEHYLQQSMQMLEAGDLEKTIEYLHRAEPLIPLGHPNQHLITEYLGTAFKEQFKSTGRISDIDGAILYQTRLVALMSNNHSDLPSLFDSLGNLCWTRFNYQGGPKEVQEVPSKASDLDKAAQYLTNAAQLTPASSPNLLRLLEKLGAIYGARFSHRGALADIDKAIEYQTKATRLTPDECDEASIRLDNLGSMHGMRLTLLDELDDNNKAIECKTRAISLTPAGHSLLPIRHFDLGRAFLSRFQSLDEIGDMENAVTHVTHAIALTPEGDKDLPERLNLLGELYTRRFERFDDMSDIDKAVEYAVRAVALTPSDHEKMSRHLDALGCTYLIRSQYFRNLEDINKSVEYTSRAVAAVREEDSIPPVFLNNAGSAYWNRFEFLGNLRDVDQAIKYKTRAIELTSEGNVLLSPWLNNLGSSYHSRFQVSEEAADIDKSIELRIRALGLTPEGHQDLPTLLSNLGGAYSDRYKHFCTPNDLDMAINYGERAVALTPENHPHLPLQLEELGDSYLQQLESQDDDTETSLISAIECYKRSAMCLTGHPRIKIRSARSWGQCASNYRAGDPTEAYRVALEALPRLIWLGSTVEKRYEDLHEIPGLAVDAAAAAINAQNYDLALEWLEQARSIIWNQTLQLRTPLDYLYAAYPTLAERLEQAACQLNGTEPNTHTRADLPWDGMDSEHIAQQYRQYARDYEALISEIRKLPGFGDFLQPKTTSELVRAAVDGPIIVINCYRRQCDALIILPGSDQVKHVPLPDFASFEAHEACDQIEQSLKYLNLRERNAREQRRPIIHDVTGQIDSFEEVLASLWVDVVDPILSYLGYKNLMGADLPHITWCLTGALSFLPLHAAGYYDRPGAKLSDYAISSYTPTISALLASTPSNLQSTPRGGVLAVGQESTPGHSWLPGTSQELAHINNHTHRVIQLTQLVDHEATPKAVLEAMEHHDWVHLACHAHQNVNDPSESGFFLHGGTLNIAEIRQKQFTGKGLAFLSACQTATGDQSLPDEAIHLASGILMAGYPSVIATMWSVMDSDAPFVADRVYGQLLKGGKMDRRGAAKALHNAVVELREKVGYKEFSRWMPYIHVGA